MHYNMPHVLAIVIISGNGDYVDCWLMNSNWIMLGFMCNGVDSCGMLWENKINFIATDALAPCVARPSAVMLLNMQDEWVIIIYNNGLTNICNLSVEKL